MRRRDWRWVKVLLLQFCLFGGLTRPAIGQGAGPVSNPGFERGDAGTFPPGWHAGIAADAEKPGTTYTAVIDTDHPRTGRASVRLDSPDGTIAASDFGTVTSSIDALPYRGRRVRLTGAVRAIPGDDGKVGLWLRVDRGEGQTGFFDNMDRRPITDAGWTDYSIEGDVAADASKIVFGLLLIGHGHAWLDDVRLEDIGPAHGTGIPLGWGNRPRSGPTEGDEPPRPLAARGLINLRSFARLYGLVRFFHPSDEATNADWNQIALAGVAKAENAKGPLALADALRATFQPIAPTIEIFSKGAPHKLRATRPAGATSALRWHHLGFGSDPGHVYSSERAVSDTVRATDMYVAPLPGGLSARVPLAVWRDAKGRTLPQATVQPIATGKPAGFVPAGFDRTTRLAAIVAAWSMLNQFYPYFDRQKNNWGEMLDRSLREAATDADDLAFRDTLRRLVSRLHDGHGSVPYYVNPTGLLPLAWDWVQGRLVVTASGTDQLKRGDLIEAVDGVPSVLAISRRAALLSGSRQWTRSRAIADLLSGPPGKRSVLTVRAQNGLRIVTLSYSAPDDSAAVTEPKPASIAEVEPGIMYVDLDRVTQSGFDSHIPDLAKARGLIFDLRGYPRMSPDFLRHMTDRPIQSGHFVTLSFDRPDEPGRPAGDGQWTLQPLAPRFTRNLVFITNESAISYSESILSVVAGNHLADIVGSPSAGANGNITFFDLPGGYQISWTGMRVTNLDESRHYLIGIRPTVPVVRTLAGVRAGRDALLDRAKQLVRLRMKKAGAGSGNRTRAFSLGS